MEEAGNQGSDQNGFDDIFNSEESDGQSSVDVDDNDLFGDNGSEHNSENDPVEENDVLEVDPEAPYLTDSDSEWISVQLPSTVCIEKEMYDDEKVKNENPFFTEVDKAGKPRLRYKGIENTIRFKQGEDHAGEPVIECNTQFTEDDDGSLIMILNDEVYTIKESAVEERAILVNNKTNKPVDCGPIKKKWTIRPKNFNSPVQQAIQANIRRHFEEASSARKIEAVADPSEQAKKLLAKEDENIRSKQSRKRAISKKSKEYGLTAEYLETGDANTLEEFRELEEDEQPRKKKKQVKSRRHIAEESESESEDLASDEKDEEEDEAHDSDLDFLDEQISD